MRLQMTASVLTVLCAWVLWEKWIYQNPGEPTARIIQAVLETKTLDECRAATPGFAKERAEGFRRVYKEPEYAVTSGDYAAILTHKQKVHQQYLFYCLPPTADPYKDPQ